MCGNNGHKCFYIAKHRIRRIYFQIPLNGTVEKASSDIYLNTLAGE